jgi:PST family polysaccharide transporter
MTLPWVAELRRQLARAGVREALRNVTWLTGERVLQLGVGMFVGVWVARALGPERFGLYNYALAFASLFASVASLGTDAVVVRDLVRDPGRGPTIVGTAFRLRVVGAIAITGALAAVALAIYRHDPTTLALILLFGLATPFKAFDVIDPWFQARTQASPVVRARSAAFLVGSAARVAVLVAAGGSVIALAAVEPLVAAVGAVLLVYAFRRASGAPLTAGWDRAEARALLRDSWPMLLAGMGVIVYMRLDQIMLEHLGGAAGTHELGLYSAALRLSEATYMLPTAVVTAVFPHIVHSRREGAAVYESRLARLYAVMTALALALAIPATFLARPIIALVFGARFAGAAPILAIHVWTALFAFWGVVSMAWMVNEGLTQVAPIRTLQGAVLNVLLNLWLIPRHGGLGAAVATLVAQGCAVWLLNATDRRTRPIFVMQARSLLLGRLRP